MLETASLAVDTLVDNIRLIEKICCGRETDRVDSRRVAGKMDRVWGMDWVCAREVANAQVVDGQRERVYSLKTSREVAM